MNLKPSFNLNLSPNQSNYYWFNKVVSQKELSHIDNLQSLYSYIRFQ